MVLVDITTGSAVTRRLGTRTDQSHSTIDDSFEDTQSVPAASRTCFHDDFHPTARFVEAMKNPDWRKRGENSVPHDSSCHTTYEPSTVRDPGISHYIPAMRSSSHHSQPGTPNVWNHVVPQTSRTVSLASSKSLASFRAENEQVYASTIDPENTIEDFPGQQRLCSMVRHRDLTMDDAIRKPLSILEVVPYYPGDADKHSEISTRRSIFSSLVQIRRLNPNGKTRHQLTKSEQMRELNAVLAATEENAPNTWDRHTSHSVNVDLSKSKVISTTSAALDKTHRATHIDHAVTNPGLVTKPKKGSDPFEKMLQKLKGVGKPGKDRGERKQDATSQGLVERTCCQPIGASLRNGVPRSTCERTSDSGVDVDLITVSRGKDGSEDSGISLGNSGLNPRAREFLSFKRSGEDEMCFDDQPSLPTRQSLAGLFGKGNHIPNQESLTGPGPANPTPFLADQFPGGSTDRENAPCPERRLPAQRENVIPVPGFSPLIALPPLGALGVPSVLGSGIGMDPGCSNVPDSGGIAVKAMNPMAPPFIGTGHCQIPLMAPLPSAPAVAPPQYDPARHTNLRPQPVSKPRAPNAASQQAYEAWIEWRKANEPGYAMECKSRQQRRARRNAFAQAHSNMRAQPPTSTVG